MYTILALNRPWDTDRVMNTDIDAATELLSEQRVWNVTKPFIESYHSEKNFDFRPPSPTATILGKMSRLDKQLQLAQAEKLRGSLPSKSKHGDGGGDDADEHTKFKQQHD